MNCAVSSILKGNSFSTSTRYFVGFAPLGSDPPSAILNSPEPVLTMSSSVTLISGSGSFSVNEGMGDGSIADNGPTLSSTVWVVPGSLVSTGIGLGVSVGCDVVLLSLVALGSWFAVRLSGNRHI